MNIKKNALQVLCAVFLGLTFVCIGVPVGAQDAGDVKTVSVDQICGEYMDYPMSADSLYRDKMLKTTIEVSHVRKIHSLCDDAPQGTFTMNAVTRNGTIVQCFCNAPLYQSVLHNTPRGSHLTVQGTYKSLTSSFFEGESKQCTLTLANCSFK